MVEWQLVTGSTTNASGYTGTNEEKIATTKHTNKKTIQNKRNSNESSLTDVSKQALRWQCLCIACLNVYVCVCAWTCTFARSSYNEIHRKAAKTKQAPNEQTVKSTSPPVKSESKLSTAIVLNGINHTKCGFRYGIIETCVRVTQSTIYAYFVRCCCCFLYFGFIRVLSTLSLRIALVFKIYIVLQSSC